MKCVCIDVSERYCTGMCAIMYIHIFLNIAIPIEEDRLRKNLETGAKLEGKDDHRFFLKKATHCTFTEIGHSVTDAMVKSFCIVGSFKCQTKALLISIPVMKLGVCLCVLNVFLQHTV